MIALLLPISLNSNAFLWTKAYSFFLWVGHVINKFFKYLYVLFITLNSYWLRFIISEENIALQKPATQSDVLWNYSPDLALDGDLNSCSFTSRKDGPRWWQVRFYYDTRIKFIDKIWRIFISYWQNMTFFYTVKWWQSQ